MPRIPESFIESIVDRTDIVDVISDYVTLKRAGNNRFVACCPFHSEKTPSFSVDGDKQLFYCFGCHVGGNVISFLEKKENYTYVETIEELARRANVDVPYEKGENKPSVSREIRTRILEANKEAARFYFNTLFEPEGTEGMDYFINIRGLGENIIKRFGLGYAPDARDSLIKHLKQKGFDEDTLVLAGLAVRNEYGIRDTFRTRVMFPIITQTGDIIAFGGRVLDSSKPKYLNTNDMPVFNKRKNLYAYNLLKKNSRRRAIICEGYMDVIALNAAGFDCGVASLGTAVTPEQVKLLKRSVDEVYVCYDGDTAGISATHKVIDLMKAEGMKPRIIALPIGVDPDEYIKANGAPAFSEMMKKAKTSIEYLIDEASAECDMKSEEGRAEFAQKATQIISKYAFDSIEQEMYLKRVHSLSGFSMDALMNSSPAISGSENAAQASNYGIVKRFNSVTERALVAVLSEHPELKTIAAENLKEEYFEDSAYLRIYKYILSNSEKTDIKTLIRAFQDDEKCVDALSAVGIEDNVFGDSKEFLKDCCLKMHMGYLSRKREEMKEKLSASLPAEEQIAAAAEMAKIDKEIKNLRRQF